MATPAPVFPGAVATDANLKIGRNLILTTLRVSCTPSDTVLFVQDAAPFAANVLVSIDNEIIAISAINTGSTPSLVVASGGRGFDGTTAAAHQAGAKVSMLIVAWHHNALASEIQAIEQFMGPNGQNLARSSIFYNAANYNFAAQTPGGTLAAGANIITLTPVPKGVNGSNTGYTVYISSGSGAPEVAAVTGGSAASGAASGTLIINCANSHSGAWTVTSATGGIQEAICDMPTGGGVVIVGSDVTLRTNVVYAGKTEPSVWKLSGTSISGAFSVLEQTPDPTRTEYVTGPHTISGLLGTFNNRVAALSIYPVAHDPFPPAFGCGMAVGQGDPTQITMNQFFHGIVSDVHTNNVTPNQNAAVLGFMYSHGGADPFGADLHGVVPSTATAVPAYCIGVQAETEVDIAAPGTSIYPLLAVHETSSGTKATAMIQLNSVPGGGCGLLLSTDSNVFTNEGIVLRPHDDANPLYRTFAVTNAANTKNVFNVAKNGMAYFDGSVVASNYNYISNETGANNAIAGTFSNNNVPTIVAGMDVVIKLSHSLQAGPNTFNLNGTGPLAIRSHFNVNNNIATPYPAGAMIRLCYEGTMWVDMSQ